MKLLNTFFFLLLMIAFADLAGQDINNVQLPHLQLDHSRKIINIPNILGYKTLKCDFHIHTIFSDGVVWPDVRVQEAWEEGLDAIAITEHIENQPSKSFVGGDHNASYDEAEKRAKELGIILIRGGEITRDMPPGHLNAFFLSDVNALATETPFQAIEAAAKQKAFIMWNHPGWKAQQPDTCLWWPEHEDLYQKGWIHGIEVFNEKEWYPIALDWCHDKKVAVMANSDIHDVTGHYYDLVNGHRPMTLVLSEDLSAEGIREALFARRTLAFFDNMLAGEEIYLKAIFEASVKITLDYKNEAEGNTIYNVENNSGIPYNIAYEGNQIVLSPNGIKQVHLPSNLTQLKVQVTNLLVRSDAQLEIEIQL